MTGERYNNLIVVSVDHSKALLKGTYWICRCDCGGEISLRRYDITTGRTKTCRSCRLSTNSRDPLYIVWINMKSRCYNPKHPQFKDYGARGLIISDDWKLSFKTFQEDMPGYAQGLTLERKDNSRGYSKENCEWSSFKNQNNNRRSNRLIEYRGRSLTLTQWAEELGMNPGTLVSRIDNSKWTIEKAFTTPLLRKKK
jgi:hypothetical protein